MMPESDMMANNSLTIDLTSNHNAEIVSISIVFAFLAILSVVARVASRKMQKIPLALDDYLLVFSWVNSSLLEGGKLAMLVD